MNQDIYTCIYCSLVHEGRPDVHVHIHVHVHVANIYTCITAASPHPAEQWTVLFVNLSPLSACFFSAFVSCIPTASKPKLFHIHVHVCTCTTIHHPVGGEGACNGEDRI